MDAVGRLVSELRPHVANEQVLAAIAAVPREHFVDRLDRRRAYENRALPIACGQTISQPLVVARMLAVLELETQDRVLDIGTGSGYHAALLALLAGHVLTIERHPQLAARARQKLAALGLDNVEVIIADGTEGVPERGPFDAINVAAATGDEVPGALERQLAPGGRMVVPVGEAEQHLILVRRTAEGLRRTTLEAVRFVPLVPGPPA